MEALALAPRLGEGLPRARRIQADDRFIERLQRGEASAFAFLYELHYAELVRFCARRLRGSADAEDAVQQTMISAYSALRRNARPVELRPWLYAIARNRCTAIVRATRELPAELPETATPDCLFEVELRETVQELVRDVARLPPFQRAALILSEVVGLNHAEVAELLDCETPKVKSLVFRARSALKDRRDARETPCGEIRGQLKTLRGGSLRRNSLRLHLEGCRSCAGFYELQRRRRAVAYFI